jgi:hypothetical protein
MSLPVPVPHWQADADRNANIVARIVILVYHYPAFKSNYSCTKILLNLGAIMVSVALASSVGRAHPRYPFAATQFHATAVAPEVRDIRWVIHRATRHNAGVIPEPAEVAQR